MAVKIRLKRIGKIRQPYYRIVAVDSRKKRDGRVIEEIGIYHPKNDPSVIEVNSERAQYWLGVGAQPSEAVQVLLKLTGDWQLFKGEPAPGPLKVAEPKRDKAELFNEALKDVASEPKSGAVTKKASKKTADADAAADAPAEDKSEAKTEDKTETKTEDKTDAKADTPAAEAKADEAPAADATTTES